METLSSETFLRVIQLAITPVIMLSGVGAFLITLTNRMGRVVDRTRALAGQLRQIGATSAERPHLEAQLEILWRRARLVRRAVTYAGISMLLSCTLVMVIFVDAIRESFGVELVITFVGSVLFLIVGLLAFLRDIWMSLWALRVEVDQARQSR